MSTYQSTLPLVFRYLAVWDEEDVRIAVDMLLKEDDSVPAGSSFAVTSDAYMFGGDRWHRRLWLSEVSYRRLVDSGEFSLCPDVISLVRRDEEY